MFYSVGILYSVYTFLELIKKVEIIDSDFVKTFNQFNVANASSVLEASIKYNWVSVNSENKLFVTSKGETILKISHESERLRVQLTEMILQDTPLWAKNFHLGRNEVVQFLKPNIYQCLKEANLLNGYSSDIVEWWDNISYFTRSNSDIYLCKLGRHAEGLSVKYEAKRIGRSPKWVSIDSNLVGYDMLSVLSSSDNTLLPIEVKAFHSSSTPRFYLSANEWEVAINSTNYIFHIWKINENDRMLYILYPDDIMSIIPKNTEYANWEKVLVSPPSSLLDKRKA